MIIHFRLRFFILSAIFYSIMMPAWFYFAYSAYTGARGVVANQEADAKMVALSQEFEKVHQERVEWQRRVQQLSGPEIDHDLLDERQRFMLSLVDKNEVVVLLPQASSR